MSAAAAISKEALLAAAQRALGPGITREQAVIIGYAELSGEPLDPWLLDDAAVILRAERLLIEGLLAAEAIATARREHATWTHSGAEA